MNPEQPQEEVATRPETDASYDALIEAEKQVAAPITQEQKQKRVGELSKEDRERAREWMEADEVFFAWMHRTYPEQAKRMEQAAATLKEGKKVSEMHVSAKGMNAIFQQVFEDIETGEMVEGFKKPCRASYYGIREEERIDEDGNAFMVKVLEERQIMVSDDPPKFITRTIGALVNGLAEVDPSFISGALNPNEQERYGEFLVKRMVDRQAKAWYTKEIMGKRYGIPDKDMHLPEDDGRLGVQEGMSSERMADNEVAFHRLAVLCGAIEEVPLTVLRQEKGELYSVQERANVPGKEVRAMSVEELINIGKNGAQGETERVAGEFMHVAVLDYLFRSADRERRNFLYVKGERVFAIDNGLSLGPLGTRESKRPLFREMVSLPLSFVATHPEWKLKEGDPMVARLEAVRDVLKTVQERMEADFGNRRTECEKEDFQGTDGQALYHIFRRLACDQAPEHRSRYMTVELMELLERIEKVLSLRHPPLPPSGEFKDALVNYRRLDIGIPPLPVASS